MSSTITTTPIGSYGATMITSTTIPCNVSGNVTMASSGQYTYTTTGTGFNPSTISPSNLLNISGYSNFQGDANFQGDVKIKGKNIIELIDNIEKRLAILHPNEALEDKWEELKDLGIRYRELEKEIIEKEKMWAILKK